ncbi:hypothetical protein QQS21_009958 [Conoideocrella luteorostrata]|uniref:Ankyrin n=1 Tax=Conoideocrella luteorostrata TaxID=1105319 RepID=A0AAJ0CIN6_9HYPO|nr:hypothetical protein QQS21_009958 [Conoideocrella luteorostrata]
MSLHVEQSAEEGDPNLPPYSVFDSNRLRVRISQVSGINLPILHSPAQKPAHYLHPEWTDEEYGLRTEQYNLHRDIVIAFFDAVVRGLDDAVARFVSDGLISPDATNSQGETPLLAAIRANRSGMVRKLLSLGSLVDGYGQATPLFVHGEIAHRFRTPLQLAAESGNLAIVKILTQEYGADDSLIAPDGALALRLAAANGHREIVEFLPARRGGAWKRWKHAHQEEMRRIRRAFRAIQDFVTFFLWSVPKFILWTVPSGLARSIGERVESAWKRRHEFGRWAKQRLLELPSRIAFAASRVVKVVKKMPIRIGRMGLRLWGVLRSVPEGLGLCAQWIGAILRNAGRWVAHTVERLASFSHTLVMAIISWFKEITLNDVWNGLCSSLDAIFVGLPRLLFSFLEEFGKYTYKVMLVVFGRVGVCLWYCGAGIIWLATYIPGRIWDSLKALGRLFAKAWDEMLVYFDPKKV